MTEAPFPPPIKPKWKRKNAPHLSGKNQNMVSRPQRAAFSHPSCRDCAWFGEVDIRRRDATKGKDGQLGTVETALPIEKRFLCMSPERPRNRVSGTMVRMLAYSARITPKHCAGHGRWFKPKKEG